MIGVTGASGYIGRALTDALNARGHEVVTLGRADATRRLDLITTSGYRTALEGLSTVIHCGGLAHNEAAPEDYDKINYKATMALADAALTVGVKRFIFLSSLNLVPPAGHKENAAASSLPRPDTPYVLSKWMAEQSLEQLLRHSACELAICRPGLVYDQELTGNLVTLATIASRLPVALPSVGIRSMISRPDLVSLLILLATHEGELDGKTERFAVTDGERYSSRRIASALGCRASVTAPASLWRLVSLGRDVMGRKPAGATWRSLSLGGWTGHKPTLSGWRSEWTLETLLADKTGSSQ